MPDQAHQQIPRSLGMTLRVMRLRQDLKQHDLADELTQVPGRFRESKRGAADGDGQIGINLIGRAERSERLRYYLIDAYARWSGFPTGMIYLVSRCAADVRDGKKQGVKDVAKAIRKLADWLETNADHLAKLPPPDLQDRDAASPREQRARQAVDDYMRRYIDHDGRKKVYKGSKQQIADARLAIILDEILEHAPRPFSPVRPRRE